MKRRLCSRVLLALLLALLTGLMPGMSMTAFAADTGKAIQLVDSGSADNIGGGQADSIYFGTYLQSSDGSGGYNNDPIKWRVLENANGELFLLSDQNLDVQPYNTSNTSITWEKSTIRSWLNGYGANENNDGIDYSSDNFKNTAFSGGEQSAIAQTYVDNATQSGGNDTTDKIFFLSIEEANNSGYFPDGDFSRLAINNDYVAGRNNSMSGAGAEDYWWLRSPGTNDSNAADVTDDGYLNYGHGVDSWYIAARPAFNLNLNSVLFTSAATTADGGKADSTVDSNLTPVENYSGNEWKVTLRDDSRSGFTASTSSGTAKDEGYSDWTVDVSYSGAQTGNNEYVSVLLCDSSNNVLYYGNIARNSESGTASITIPGGLAPGSYTLKVFSEQYNGDYKTDYASAFQSVDLTVFSKIAEVPTITSQPQDKTYTIGDTANAISVEASASDGGTLSYQWYSNTTDSNSGGTQLNGETNNSYTPDISAEGTTYYYCVVTNTLGGTTAEAVSDTAKIEVKPVVEKYDQPVIIAGAGGTWQKGAKDGLSFTSNAAFAGFIKVQVDGKDLSVSDYEIKEGSTVVTLKASYLETLSIGKHTLAIVSDTGTASTEFTIKEAPVTNDDTHSPQTGDNSTAPATNDDTHSPQTGDNSNIVLWLSLMLVAGAVLAGAAVYTRKKKHSR